MKKTIVIICGSVSVVLLIFWALIFWYWEFGGEQAIKMIGHEERVRADQLASSECDAPWRNIRILQKVRSPGANPKEPPEYTAVYFEQDLNGENTKFIALYYSITPKFATCAEKHTNLYPSPQQLDDDNPPVAMAIGDVGFYLATPDGITTNYPKHAVPLEKLPLVNMSDVNPAPDDHIPG